MADFRDLEPILKVIMSVPSKTFFLFLILGNAHLLSKFSFYIKRCLTGKGNSIALISKYLLKRDMCN